MSPRPDDSAPATIRARGLACGYHGDPVLTDIGLDVRCGEVLCLLGPNGVGKTTLFRTLLGHLAAVRGTIEIGGELNRPRREAQPVRATSSTVKAKGGSCNWGT